MPLVKTTDLLADCKQNHSAVGAFNINGLDQPQALIRRAEELGAPLIVVEPGVIEKYVNFEDFVAVTRRAARSTSIPFRASSYRFLPLTFNAEYMGGTWS